MTNKDSDKYFLPFTRLSVCLTNFLKQSPVTQAIIPVTADREAEVAGHKGTPCFHTARVVDGTHLLLPRQAMIALDLTREKSARRSIADIPQAVQLIA